MSIEHYTRVLSQFTGDYSEPQYHIEWQYRCAVVNVYRYLCHLLSQDNVEWTDVFNGAKTLFSMITMDETRMYASNYRELNERCANLYSKISYVTVGYERRGEIYSQISALLECWWNAREQFYCMEQKAKKE